jgi:hypothetical protein
MGTGADPLDLEVPPARVRDPRGGGRAGWAALAGIAAVIVAAIGIAQVVPPRPAPPHLSSAVPTIGPTGAAAEPSTAAVTGSTPDPSAILADSPPRLSREELAAAVRDGSLEGRLVFVEGVMRATAMPCASQAPASRGCVRLEIPGIGVPVRPGEIDVPVRPGEFDTPWPGEPPPDAWLVTVARDGGLVYLGSLVPSEDGVRTIDRIVEGFGPRGRDWVDGTLFEVDGYLVVDPIHPCRQTGRSATPCPAPSPFLAYDEPLPDGILVSDEGAVVELSASMPEIDPDAVVTMGRFLLAPPVDDGKPWRVVARYEPSRAVRVVVP